MTHSAQTLLGDQALYRVGRGLSTTHLFIFIQKFRALAR